MELRCKYCGSLNLETEKKGTQTGVYCCDCGKWLKWATKEEIRLINHREEYTVKKNPTLIDISVIEDIKAEIEKVNIEVKSCGKEPDIIDYRCGLRKALEIINKHIGNELAENNDKLEDNRKCDRCGAELTNDNNKCGYDICDKCNKYLEEKCKGE